MNSAYHTVAQNLLLLLIQEGYENTKFTIALIKVAIQEEEMKPVDLI